MPKAIPSLQAFTSMAWHSPTPSRRGSKPTSKFQVHPQHEGGQSISLSMAGFHPCTL